MAGWRWRRPLSGLALSFGPTATAAFAPWPAAAAGLVGAAAIVGPLLRRANASAAADVVATRFQAAPVRLVFGLIAFVVGGLTAAAGFAAAVDALVAAAGLSRRLAEIAIAATLIAGVVPGGLRGLLWSDAASFGAALAVAAIGAAAAWSGGGGGEPAAAGWLAVPAGSSDAAFLLRAAAVGFVIAGFLPFIAPALGAPAGQARRAGAFGLALIVVAAALGATAWAGFTGPRGDALAGRRGAGRRSGVVAGGGVSARWRARRGARRGRRSGGRLCAVRRAGEPAHRAVALDHGRW